MFGRIGGVLVVGGLLLLAGLSCIDESPTRPEPSRVFFSLSPGAEWTFEYVIDDSARTWMIQVRDARVVVMGDTFWALDYYADGALTLTDYFAQESGRLYLAGERSVAWEDTFVMVFSPPLLYSPATGEPGETWSSVGAVTNLKITPATPVPETLVTEGYLALTGRVLGEERVTVPASDEPLETLWVEYYGEADPWSPPEMHTYFWYAEDIGPVQTVDLVYGGQTVNRLTEYVQGK